MSELYKKFELGNKVLKIYHDSDVENPREWDNLGAMVCWHRRYNLGDDHNYDSEYFVYQLAEELGIATELQDEEGDWVEREEKVIWEEVQDKIIILPLYLYDHSGITMNTGGFFCQWDSGQVGWIFATREKFRKETFYSENELFSTDIHRIPVLQERVKIKGYEGKGYAQIESIEGGEIIVNWDYNKALNFRKPENVCKFKMADIAEVLSNKAEEMLKNEVEVYDQYLTGEVFGFVIEEKEECPCCKHVENKHVDSCWGFYGDDFVENGMVEAVGEEWREFLV